MGIFGNIARSGGKSEPGPVVTIEAPVELRHADESTGEGNRRVRRRTGRTDVYAVRVRESFKGEILTLQAELQLERQKSNGKARKVTAGEIIELMLETYKGVRRNGDCGNAVPLTKDIWDGVHEIARRLQSSPAVVVEQLVVHKIAELGLLPRNRKRCVARPWWRSAASRWSSASG
jgi:hypothetical protein